MIDLGKIFAGFVCFFFCVFQPVRASLLTSVAIQYVSSAQDRIMLFTHANVAEPCDTNILNVLGDTYVSQGNFVMAAVTYGNAMTCSPGYSLMRYKYGESLFAMGYNGIENLREALTLEPNNPIYQREYKKFTEPLSQSQ